MREAEYLAATNLAKLRIAHSTLYDVVFLRANDANDRRTALDLLRKLIEQHEVEVEKMTHA